MKSKTSFNSGRSKVDWDSMVEDDFNSRRMVRKHLTRKQFAARLFNLANERGWNQAETARQAGVTRDSVSNYMRGSYLPDAVNLRKLADAFGLKPEDLLPNIIETELKVETKPSLEVRTGADPTTSWVLLNRLIKSEGLPELMALINKYGVTANDD